MWPKLIGVEMEAAGVATAAFQSVEQPGFFMVRGVSDLADENKNTTNVGKWRQYACDIAATFTISLLKSGPVPLSEKPIQEKTNNTTRVPTNQPEQLQIKGNITAANVVIGGTQTVHGGLTIHNVHQKSFTCPTAPNPPEHFTGREDTLDELRRALSRDESVAITAVCAMGGMGKTSLAQMLCHSENAFFDAVLWAEIGENPQIIPILTEWASYAVDDYKLPADAQPEAIAGWVRGQMTQLMHQVDGCGPRWLAVFDDVWNLQASYDAVNVLRAALPPGCKVLVTTRQSETAAKLCARSIELDELSDPAALELLKKLRYNRHLTDAHLEKTVALIKGHPLTLELASASLNEAISANNVSTILHDYETGIKQGSPLDAVDLEVDLPRYLNVVFGRSYYCLPEADRQRFRALGTLAADAAWTFALAGELWEITDERALTRALKKLISAGLIQLVEAGAETNYRQHRMLRAYACALLKAAGSEQAAEFKRYATFVTRQAEQFDLLPPEKWGGNGLDAAARGLGGR